MPERKSMRRIKECLRLYYEAHQSQSAVARALGVARSTVWDYLQRVEREELSWAQLRDLPADELEARLFSTPEQGEDTRLLQGRQQPRTGHEPYTRPHPLAGALRGSGQCAGSYRASPRKATVVQ